MTIVVSISTKRTKPMSKVYAEAMPGVVIKGLTGKFMKPHHLFHLFQLEEYEIQYGGQYRQLESVTLPISCQPIQIKMAIH